MTDSQMDAPELLPCPFCGGEAKAKAYIVDSAVWCCDCRSTLPRVNSDYGEYGLSEAIAAWNRRATPEALAADPAVKALIAAERERCAGECDRTAREADMFGDKHGRQISERTAAAIRGETP